MITSTILEIYLKFDGDIDHLARMQNYEDNKIISDENWAIIESFKLDIRIIQRGNTSQQFIRVFEQNVLEFCDDDTKEYFLNQIKDFLSK